MLRHLIALALAMVLTMAAVVMHYEALRVLSLVPGQVRVSARMKILLVIMGVTAAHVVEAGIFAVGYGLGEGPLHLGKFVGADELTPIQTFYFSLETFTTQSVGDLYPVGPLRLVASLEPLAGLILIGWSTSFTFLMMRRYWRLKTPKRTSAPASAPDET